MKSKNTPRFYIYIALSITGFISAMYFNGLAVLNKDDYLKDWSASAATNVLTWDLMIVAIAGAIFIIVEGQRLKMKRPWVYVALSGITAMAFTFPLFLAMRERHLAKTQNER